jgi:hypothetical protein
MWTVETSMGPLEYRLPSEIVQFVKRVTAQGPTHDDLAWMDVGIAEEERLLSRERETGSSRG